MLILQDIDGVSYPFKQQVIKYLRDKELLPESVIKEFESSDYIYFHDYFLNTGLDLSELGFQEASELNNWFRQIIREFGDTEYFLEGYNKELKDLNHELKKEGYEIHGLTARCCDKYPNKTYNNARHATRLWSEKHDIGFEEIHFKSARFKHEILDYVGDVVCMIDDTPTALEGFLDKGVNCILLNNGHPHKTSYVEKLKGKYGDKLVIVHSLEDIKPALKKFRKK